MPVTRVQPLRKVHTFSTGQVIATVYRDSEWDEYVVKYHVGGSPTPTPEATWYYTGDYADAKATAIAESCKMDKALKSGAI